MACAKTKSGSPVDRAKGQRLIDGWTGRLGAIPLHHKRKLEELYRAPVQLFLPRRHAAQAG